MKYFKLFIFLILITYQTSLTAYSSDPKEFVAELINDAIEKLSDKDLNKEQKAEFISKVALDNVDIKALGLYTLGELRKSSKKEEISKYQKVFELYFLKSLINSSLAKSISPITFPNSLPSLLINMLVGKPLNLNPLTNLNSGS